MPTVTQVDSEDLADLVHGLWRAVVRAARVTEHLSPLPQSQVVLLRHLFKSGPRTPAQLADELHLARPTISNLVRELTEAGLLERQRSEVDRRSVLLVPTPRSHEVLDRFSHARADVISDAVAALPDADRRLLAAAVPTLSALMERLEAMAGDAPDWPAEDHTAI